MVLRRRGGTFLQDLEPWEAFELIPKAVNLVISANHYFIAHEFFMVLQSLYALAHTTEIHPYLIKNWDALVTHMSSFGESHAKQVEQLQRDLRMPLTDAQ